MKLTSSRRNLSHSTRRVNVAKAQPGAVQIRENKEAALIAACRLLNQAGSDVQLEAAVKQLSVSEAAGAAGEAAGAAGESDDELRAAVLGMIASTNLEYSSMRTLSRAANYDSSSSDRRHLTFW